MTPLTVAPASFCGFLKMRCFKHYLAEYLMTEANFGISDIAGVIISWDTYFLHQILGSALHRYMLNCQYKTFCCVILLQLPEIY